MSAIALLSELRAAGVTLAVTGDRLKVEAAPGIITPELTARLKVAKPELLALLSVEPIDTEPAQDLPLLAAVNEYHALIDRLICPDADKHEYHARANQWSAEHILSDLPSLRELVARHDVQKPNHDDKK